MRKDSREADELGIEIIRFANDQVINDTDMVIEEIKRTITALKQKQIQVLNQDTKAR